MAYGDAGWKLVSSSIGTLSFGTLPKTSEDEHTCITAFGEYFNEAFRIFSVPSIFV